LALSVCRLTQLRVQRSGLGATQLDEHAGKPVEADVAQFAVGAEHLFVQDPQVRGSFRLVSQPRSPFPALAQWANPGTQAVGAIWQVPATQLTPVVTPCCTFFNVEQLWPQVPQLALSV
jgi:hypothetical protein